MSRVEECFTSVLYRMEQLKMSGMKEGIVTLQKDCRNAWDTECKERYKVTSDFWWLVVVNQVRLFSRAKKKTDDGAFTSARPMLLRL